MESDKLHVGPFASYGSTAGSSTVQEDFKGVGDHSVAFLDVSYAVTQGVRICSKPGLMLPGLNAILGPTGSGKTTLLDILADRKAGTGLSGAVLINGEERPKNFRFLAGYVVQDDIVMGTLTVRENLHFSAALRLPSQVTWEERKQRVEKVINELGLGDCASQLIGTEFVRGVSGGEKKRTNIGMELIIEPQVLFLDEPTTGLDAHTAVSVVQLLKELSTNGNRIVVLSIHQPRYSIFKLFDSLTLLSRRNLVYHGATSNCLGYFTTLGFRCEEHDNPADFVLDVITSCEKKEEKSADDKENESTASSPLINGDVVQLGNSFMQSEEHRVLIARIQPMLDTLMEKQQSAGYAIRQQNVFYATNFFWQLAVVSYRSILKMWRNPMTSVLQIAVMIIFAVLVGGIYFQLDHSPLGLEDRIGAFFFIIMTQVFGNLGAIEVFIKEKAAFLHENTSGYYSVSAFFLAKVLTDLIPLRILPLSIYCVITYFMIGFQRRAEKFFIFYLTVSLTSVAGTAVAFAFSAMVNVFAVANLLVSLIYVFMMLFGGFLHSLSTLPGWIQWMKYVSLFRYAIEALCVNELNHQFFNGTVAPNGTCGSYVREGNFCIANGTAVLSYKGYSVHWLWYDQIALAVSTVIWLTAAYIMLRIVKMYYRFYR